MILRQDNRQLTLLKLLLLAFVLLQVADAVTTNHLLLSPNLGEENPIMAMAMAKLGSFWWLPKLATIAPLLFIAYRRRHDRLDKIGRAHV